MKNLNEAYYLINIDINQERAFVMPEFSLRQCISNVLSRFSKENFSPRQALVLNGEKLRKL